MSHKILFFVGLALLGLGFLLAVTLYRGGATDTPGWSPGGGTGSFVRAGAPVKGEPDAPVTIVEFLDPACGTCAQFYPLVNQLLQQYPGKLRVMVRYAPLHPGSGEVVKMLEAAHLQGQFWPALELLFSNQNRWVANHRAQPDRARRLLNAIALDHARLDADIQGAEVDRAVQQDVRDGAALGVQATPEFFVNGQPLPSFGWEQLRRLVAEAVAQQP